jgi:hypothetical protein
LLGVPRGLPRGGSSESESASKPVGYLSPLRLHRATITHACARRAFVVTKGQANRPRLRGRQKVDGQPHWRCWLARSMVSKRLDLLEGHWLVLWWIEGVASTLGLQLGEQLPSLFA